VICGKKRKERVYQVQVATKMRLTRSARLSKEVLQTWAANTNLPKIKTQDPPTMK